MTKTYTLRAWQREATRRFGPDPDCWAWLCPACGHRATAADYRAAGAPAGAVAFSCIGRWAGTRREAFGDGDGPGPCTYTSDGLFAISPITLIGLEGDRRQVFDFAPPAGHDSAVCGIVVPGGDTNCPGCQRADGQRGSACRGAAAI